VIKGVLRQLSYRYKFRHAVVHSGAKISNSSLGHDVVLFNSVTLIDCSIGNYSYVQKNSELVKSHVGHFCSIASDVIVGLAEHPTNMVSTSPVFYDPTQPLPVCFVDNKLSNTNVPVTTIESDVWIGHGAKIRAGITIGVGSIIGAGSVVVKDVEPYSVVGGVPAREIRKRFDEQVCQGLIESKWWLLSDAQLVTLSRYFTNPVVFLKMLQDGYKKDIR
jgi:acetyltransferase-like isoleucine patch superfamily enzyme